MLFVAPSFFFAFLATVFFTTASARLRASFHHVEQARRQTLYSQAIEYLDTHNAIRAEHDADPLSWNYTLASAAQEWVDNCYFAHTNGVLLPSSYGENVAAATGNFSAMAAVYLFASDESSYDPCSPTYNHFTQVVWKNTTQLGCAVNTCWGMLENRDRAIYHLCLYQPIGNVVGEAT
ncbi:PR-1-like protein [Fistulina hepatica ATCC 64428]|nr:PR-1-like protein [Fistulina hepatica ATCC 64428]